MQTAGTDQTTDAQAPPSLKAEDRRRKWLMLTLLSGVVVSTVPFINQRSLSTPLKYAAVSSPIAASPASAPVAAAGFAPNAAKPTGSRPPRSKVIEGIGDGSPRAFAAVIPPEGVPEGFVESAPSAFAVPIPSDEVFSVPGDGLGPGDPFAPGPNPPPSEPQGPPRQPQNNPPPPPPGPPDGIAVPEAATWVMMLCGFGAIGAIMRRSRRGRAESRFSTLPTKSV
ncbi:PEPxxWA-CTERM sorting domain-containing protein [Sphingobium sufflavum]|uniref:PEPxxWA-CTERM sorting domain-containing protein n=1 Tax=Sphingobium sufflavum TaxID=1129547 RepID=UPI001F2CC627|nr:PEPxxWA-CTERM sorting domain-containing protein [Sphingobium sufflavum]MCE7798311.1 PEPxxWA-CTERM sorting domain-containing protein [Sphingobium sufflavum]